MACYLCSAADDPRTCDDCKRHVCRACATSWPTYPMAIRMRIASFRPCTITAARRDVDDAREWLQAQGVEPRF